MPEAMITRITVVITQIEADQEPKAEEKRVVQVRDDRHK